MKVYVFLIWMFCSSHNQLIASVKDGLSAQSSTVAEDMFSDVDVSPSLSDISSSSSSTGSDSPELFSSKKKLLTFIESYLQYDKNIPEESLNKEMKLLRKKKFSDLLTDFDKDEDFKTRYNFLKYVKTFLIRYKNSSEDEANKQINELNKLPLEQMYQKYYVWCQQLTKDQMLTMIHDHIQFDQHFFHVDADQEITKLSNRPLQEIRDRFMQYQHTFVTHDIHVATNVDKVTLERDQQMQKAFSEQVANRSIVARIPLVHNIKTLLSSSVTNWSDQELFLKLAQKMQDLGWDSKDIHAEIQRLKDASIATLQKDYPNLQKALARRLYYFDTVKNQASDAITNVDSLLQIIHTWSSTAAMVASYASSFAQYDPTIFSMIAAFPLLNTTLTLSTGVTKRDLLDMMYAQYSVFDSFKHLYFNPEYQEIQMWTKQELIGNIAKTLDTMKIRNKARIALEQKCHAQLSKDELEALYEELQFLNKNKISMSSLEKKMLLQTKPELLASIRADLKELKIPQETIEKEIDALSSQQLCLVRAARLDIQEALHKKPLILHVMPELTTSMEKLINNMPAVVKDTVTDQAAATLTTHLQAADKSPAYIAWKTIGLQNRMRQNTEHPIDRAIDVGSKLYQMKSVLKSTADIAYHVVGQ